MTDQEKEDYIKKLYKEARNFYENEEYEKSLDRLEKILKINSNNAKAFSLQGNNFHKLKKYEKAIKAYDEAAKLYENNNKANASLYKGKNLSELKKYTEALEAYDKAIDLFKNNNDRAKAYLNKGITLYYLKEYNQAIEAYDKASKLYDNNNKAKAFANKGIVFYTLKTYKKALNIYDQAIDLFDSNNDKARTFLLRGITFNKIKKYEKAIREYNQAIDLFDSNNDKAESYLYKGSALQKLNRIQDAIPLFEETISLSDNNLYIGLAYLKLENWKEAGIFLGKKGREIIEIISLLEEEYKEANTSDVLCNLLKNKPNDYFWKVLDRTNICKIADRPCDQHTESCSNCKIEQACGVYRDIYLKSLEIITNVQVNFDFEEKVAHYTTKDSARLLLLGKNGKKVNEDDKKPSQFRLASTARANDPNEGQTLFDYLLGNQKQTPLGTADSNYRAFIGCFTFNHQSLNQFRLYGKEKGREASGISIVIKKDYFNEKIEVTQNMKTAFVTIDKNIEPSTEKEEKKLSLFRCIYIDPETEAIISLGHKELYAYIREEMEKNKRKKVYRLKKKHATYLSKIEEQLDKVTNLLEQLRVLVSKPDLNPQTISELLLMLSHLVKHVAFKEEQECRILEIASLTDGDEKVKVESEIDNNCYRMFIDYRPMTDSVDRLYMGNQFEDFALFKDMIKQKYNGKAPCYLSTHPFAIT